MVQIWPGSISKHCSSYHHGAIPGTAAQMGSEMGVRKCCLGMVAAKAGEAVSMWVARRGPREGEGEDGGRGVEGEGVKGGERPPPWRGSELRWG